MEDKVRDEKWRGMIQSATSIIVFAVVLIVVVVAIVLFD